MTNKKSKIPNWKTIHPRDIANKTIFKVYDASNGYKSFPSKSKAAPLSKLANFEVKTKNKTWLVLDNYGDEQLTDLFRDYIFAYKMFEHTLAIDKKIGNIYEASFVLENKRVCMIVSSLRERLPSSSSNWIKIPKTFLKRLDELKSKKRPYYLTIRDSSLISFADRHQGLSDMVDNVIICFDFNNSNLEIWDNNYREVSDWKEISE